MDDQFKATEIKNDKKTSRKQDLLQRDDSVQLYQNEEKPELNKVPSSLFTKRFESKKLDLKDKSTFNDSN